MSRVGVAVSRPKIITQDRVNRAQAVFPTDLFALGIGTTFVGNADLVNAALCPGQFGGDLWFDAKTVLAQIETFREIGAERFITRLDIGQVQIGTTCWKAK